MSYEMTDTERHDVLVRAPLDDEGVRQYIENRDNGYSHTIALGLALNDFREREKGLSWANYSEKIT